MKTIKLFCFVILAGICLFSAFTPQSTSGKNEKLKKSKRPIENRYIVVLKDQLPDHAALKDVEFASNELADLYGGKIDKQFNHVLMGYSVEMTAQEAEILSRDDRVKYVEEDAEISASDTQTGATWALDRIDQRGASLDGNYNFTNTGSGVNVYVIDSGIRATHTEFAGRVVLAYDAVRDGQNGNDCYGHGTHVAGIIGSSSFGVAKNARLHAVRVLNCTGGGSSSNLIAAVDWITANRVTPAVANISITMNGISSTLDNAITKSIAAGVTYSVAAANKSDDACSYSPARTPNAITVGATDSLDQRAGYSNFGSCVDIFAPGSSVKSTWSTSDTATATLNGTSMASPHAAGVAALYLETNPTATPGEVAAEMLRAATPGIVGNPGTNSPNLLLFSTLNSSIVPKSCAGITFTGFLEGAGILNERNYHSGINGFSGQSGLYIGAVISATVNGLSLKLERKKGSRWITVADSRGGTNNESISYKGDSGIYRWRVSSTGGSGSYSLCSKTP